MLSANFFGFLVANFATEAAELVVHMEKAVLHSSAYMSKCWKPIKFEVAKPLQKLWRLIFLKLTVSQLQWLIKKKKKLRPRFVSHGVISQKLPHSSENVVNVKMYSENKPQLAEYCQCKDVLRI